MIFAEIQQLIKAAKFSPEAEESISQILKDSYDRGYLNADDEKKLTDIISVDVFLDETELAARKDLKLILDSKTW
jgi:hypothetical protein